MHTCERPALFLNGCIVLLGGALSKPGSQTNVAPTVSKRISRYHKHQLPRSIAQAVTRQADMHKSHSPRYRLTLSAVATSLTLALPSSAVSPQRAVPTVIAKVVCALPSLHPPPLTTCNELS